MKQLMKKWRQLTSEQKGDYLFRLFMVSVFIIGIGIILFMPTPQGTWLIFGSAFVTLIMLYISGVDAP